MKNALRKTLNDRDLKFKHLERAGLAKWKLYKIVECPWKASPGEQTAIAKLLKKPKSKLF